MQTNPAVEENKTLNGPWVRGISPIGKEKVEGGRTILSLPTAWNFIIFNSGEVTYVLQWPPNDFRLVKNFRTENLPPLYLYKITNNINKASDFAFTVNVHYVYPHSSAQALSRLETHFCLRFIFCSRLRNELVWCRLSCILVHNVLFWILPEQLAQLWQRVRETHASIQFTKW